MPRTWDERYLAGEGLGAEPSPLLVRAIADLPPGRALDLACGFGRHAILLRRLGWQVTAVDASSVAIAALNSRSLEIDARVADLERCEFLIAPGAWDLICDFHYLQRDLFPAMCAGVRPYGLFVASFRLSGSYCVRPGEICDLFSQWEILHYSEAGCAEIIARKIDSESARESRGAASAQTKRPDLGIAPD